MTFNYSDNDRKMSAYLTEQGGRASPRAANARIVGNPQPRPSNFGATPAAAAHHTGGAIMGTDPSSSALNRYLQNWDASNLFVMGGAAFPQNRRPQSDRRRSGRWPIGRRTRSRANI